MQRLAFRVGIPSVPPRLLVLAVALIACSPAALAQPSAARQLITAPIDEARTVRLAGNTRPEANARNDRGRVADSLPLEHLLLLLKPPAERETELQNLIRQLHDRRSPLYHRWVRAAEFGRRFGLATQDLSSIRSWLTQHGFTVNGVYPSALMIDFSGTAGDVRTAFRTEIHALDVHGVRHMANMSDPRIPLALAPAVVGIVSLHDFRFRAAHTPRRGYTVGSGHYVVPADLATIYNLTPLFGAGVTGEGQTIAVIENSEVYSASDWGTFRSIFGLSAYGTPAFSQVQPSGPNNCANPGANGDDFEAVLDVEWASAAAPGAAIELAACASTRATDGVFLALENLVNASPPPIISISYAGCEADNGVSANAAIAAAYKQAVAAGTSVFVAAGDWGAAVCDSGSSVATHGIGVNGLASTIYNVAVGGTDFGDTYAHTTATYWSSTNTGVYGSALSYIPEIPWNDSCASLLLAMSKGFSQTYGSTGYCNSLSSFTIYAGGGGPSGCASGVPATPGVVGGSCAGTPKPSWQFGPGVPSDGVRDLPDVSLFAADGTAWMHLYIVCYSTSSVTCSSSPSTWSGGGGTSFASPILAGIQALVNQSTGARQGNPDFVYYTLAASQSASGLGCNSTSGNAVSGGCVFYDVTMGDTDVVCQGSIDCYLPSGAYGTLSTSDSGYSPAYEATAGWDFATGLGSVNAANLVRYWTSSDLSLTAGGSITPGGLLSYSLRVGDHGPQPASAVVVSTTLPAGFSLVSGMSSSFCTQSGQTVTCALGTLAVGATAPVTIVVLPNGSGPVSLAFTASSTNADLNPADGTVTVALNGTNDSSDAGSDGPLPLWAYAALGILLVLIASRRTVRS